MRILNAKYIIFNPLNVGVGFVKRNLAKATTNVVQTITIDGDKITISMTSPVSSKETTFIVGQAVEEKTLHGEKVQVFS